MSNIKNIHNKEAVKFKYIMFEFFKNVNQHRSIKKFLSVFLISVSFLQLFYLMDQIIIIKTLKITNNNNSNIYKNNTSTTSNINNNTSRDIEYIKSTDNNTDSIKSPGIDVSPFADSNVDNPQAHTTIEQLSAYEQANKLVIFDIINIAMKLSFVVPLLEYKDNILLEFYTVLFVFIYFFTIVINTLSIYCLVLIYKNKEIYFKFFLDFISSSFLYLQWILYVPILYVLLYSFNSNTSTSIIKNSEFYNSEGVKAINIIIVIFYIIINYLLSILNNDSINKYDNSLCRKDTNIEQLLFYLRSIMFFTLLLDFPYTVAIIIVGLCLILILNIFYILVTNKVFYNDSITMILGAFLFVFIQKYLGSLFLIISNTYILDYSLTIIVCFFINYYIFYYILISKRMLLLKKKIYELKSIDEVMLYIDILEKEVLNCQIGDSLACSIVSGLLLDHKNTCNSEECPLNLKKLYYPLTNTNVDIISNKVSDIQKNEIILLHLIIEIYNTLGEKFSGKSEFHFAYSMFLLYRLGNIKLALIEIENSFSYHNSLQQEYSFFILKNNSNEILLNNQYYMSSEYSKSDLSMINVIDIIVYDQLSIDLYTNMYECSKLKVEFWNILKSNKIYIEDLYKKGNQYILKKVFVNKLWKKMKLITSDNKKVNDLYIKYLEFICDDTSPNLSLKDNKKNIFSNDIDFNDIVFSRFSEETGFFIVNLSLGPLIGSIHYYNKSIDKILGYSNEYLYGKNISVILPSSISICHNYILTKFIQTGKHNLIGKSNKLFAKDKNQFIKPIDLFVLPMPSYNSKSEVLGMIKQRSSNSYYMLVDEYGEIDSLSKNFLKHDDSLCSSIINNIDCEIFCFFIFPELLFSSNRLFNIENNELFLTITAYFDYALIPVLYEMENTYSSQVNNIKKIIAKKDLRSKISKKSKEKITKIIKILKSKKIEDNKSEFDNRLEIYSNFLSVCYSYKDIIYNSMFNKNSSNDNNNKLMLEVISKTKDYINTMNKLLESNDSDNKDNNAFLGYFKDKKHCIVKKVFNLNINTIRYSDLDNYERKLLVFELTIPPTDIDNDNVISEDNENDPYCLKRKNLDDNNNNYENTSNSNKRHDLKMDKDDNSVLADDLGSISLNSINSINSINNIVNKIRDEAYGKKNMKKSSYMNFILYLLILIIFSFLIAFNIVIYNKSNQQYLKIQAIGNIFSLKRSIYDFRDLSMESKMYSNINKIKNTNQSNSYNNENDGLIYKYMYNDLNSIEERMILASLQILLIQKNIFSLFLDIKDKNIISKINLLKHNKDSNYFNDVLNQLSYYSISISKPNLNKLSNIDFDFDNEASKNSLDTILYLSETNNINLKTINTYNTLNLPIYINYIDNNNKNTTKFIDEFIENSSEYVQNSLDTIIDILIQSHYEENDSILIIIYIACIIIFFLMISFIILVFILLKQRYKQNQNILELLYLIRIDEIAEILDKVEEFINDIRYINNNIDKLSIKLINETNRYDEFDFDDSTTALSEVVPLNNRALSPINYFNAPKLNNILDSFNKNKLVTNNLSDKKTNKVITRRKNIILLFFFNIFILKLIVVLSFFFIWLISFNYIEYSNINFNHYVKTFNSSIFNQRALLDIKSIFINNNNNSNVEGKRFINTFNNTKNLNEDLFRDYSEFKNYFFINLNQIFDSIYFDNLCSTTNVNYLNYNSSLISQYLINENNDNNNFNSRIEFNINNYIEKPFNNLYILSTKNSSDNQFFKIIIDYNNKIILNNIDVNIDNTVFCKDIIDEEIKDRIFSKGFKYVIDFYTNLIENIVGIYFSFTSDIVYLEETITNNMQNSFLNIYKEKYSAFADAYQLNYNYTRLIYDYLTYFLKQSYNACYYWYLIVIIILSSVFLLLEIFAILIKWRKYIQQIKLEEYMSNKIIAEVPMYIIKKNKGIRDHLLNFSNKNL